MYTLSAMVKQPQTARGHEEPVAVQFSLFLANRVGQLKDVLEVLAEEDLEVFGLCVIDSTDWAVIRMILSDPGKAREILKGHGLPFTESRVLLVVLPGNDTLSRICSLLLNAEINVHFAYPLTVNYEASPAMVLHVDETILATQILTCHDFKLLGDEDLADSM